ncbi:hypothetical protein [Mycobacterium palustre]|uniref:Uncharacterized protein n=1 Tax=Mycobacterium palustre TaxID=153971 RepID=A0A1X1ZYB6_9MYCO|nr:hypothetical protein [Mycobacterium palustre]ORW29595.1 hypothetical protein AWC19_01600 [Mycobacterium palustre]
MTSPAGHTYVTTPGSTPLFPSLCRAVGGMPAAETDLTPDHCAERTAMMPKRRRTRAERNHNRRERLQRQAQLTGPAPPEANDGEPPPS